MNETILIDGHNLIGALPDLSLADPEDEARLVGLLKRYRARHKRAIVVVFDGAPVGGRSRELSGAGVEVVFARIGRTADALIKERVRAARAPQQITVVSSDNSVAHTARACRAQVESAQDFATRLLGELAPGETLREVRDVTIGPDEVAEWEALFKRGKKPS